MPMTDQEINEAVARKLGVISPNGRMRRYGEPRDYCHSIEAAWKIVEKLAKEYFVVEVSHDDERDLWQCSVETRNDPSTYETADTAPRAICLAFLKLGDK